MVLSRSARLRFSGLLLSGLILLPGAAAAAPPATHAVTIATARSLPLGTTVTVEGSVSTPSGAFNSSFFDLGFAIQDLTGGIFISLQTDLGVAPRARARVTGVLADSFGLRILVPADPSDVQVRPGGPKVRPQLVRTAAVGEATEGRIVRVAGTLVQGPESDLPFGYKFFVDDGSGPVQIFVNLETGIDVSTLSVGQVVVVTGFSSQFDTHYEIDPRSPADIVVAAGG
ncbi:MAG TPA: hypothetical protein PK413_07945 [Thermoanaerobaculia bacterium]|nr:hypothetical protein [Thermoanaerobaculia bacterium]